MNNTFKFFKPFPTENISIYRNLYFWLILAIVIILVIPYYVYEYARLFIDNVLPWFAYFKIFEFSNHINGMLIYVALLYSIIILSWRHAILIWILSIVIILPHVLSYSFSLSSLLINLFFFLLPMLILLLILWEFKLRENERKSLEIREYERQLYLSRIIETQEEERRRIAQELHDDTCQTLCVIGGAVKKLIDSGNNREISLNSQVNMEWIRDQIYRVSDNVRRLSLDLHPAVLDNLGLVPAIRWMAGEIQKTNDIHIDVVANGELPALSAKNDILIYRFIQEALNNVRSHSSAHNVVINLSNHENLMSVSVSDDGNGFNLPDNVSELALHNKLGLIGMQEKAKALNGTFELTTAKGEGTTVAIQFKL